MNSGPRDYARLSWKWYSDEVLVAAADEAPACMSLWPVLIGKAKEASSADNANGEFRTTLAELARIARCDQASVQDALDALADGELLTHAPGSKRGTLDVTLTRFSYWQVPRGTSADREQHRRDRASRGNVVQRDDTVTQTETQTQTQTETTHPHRPTEPAASHSVTQRHTPDELTEIRRMLVELESNGARKQGRAYSAAERRARIAEPAQALIDDHGHAAVADALEDGLANGAYTIAYIGTILRQRARRDESTNVVPLRPADIDWVEVDARTALRSP